MSGLLLLSRLVLCFLFFSPLLDNQNTTSVCKLVGTRVHIPGVKLNSVLHLSALIGFQLLTGYNVDLGSEYSRLESIIVPLVHKFCLVVSNFCPLVE